MEKEEVCCQKTEAQDDIDHFAHGMYVLGPF
jgi:hypothetical protein